jgi:hypothetical protein
MSLQTLKAHVRNGRLIMDEPTDIPEGSEIELVIADDEDNLDEKERERLHRALRMSWASATPREMSATTECGER